MFSKEVFALLREVITSWQVIAITVALVFYLNIVFYFAKAYRRPRMKLSSKINFKFKRKSKAEAGLPSTDSLPLDSNTSDELGLEEE